MADASEDIFTEPDVDPDTLANLGPLAPLAGSWEGDAGVDVHPVAGGSNEQEFVERYVLDPIDGQTNGPQLLYGLRYHTHITKPGEVETFHDQVGYWLWEPATGTVTQTLTIPRAQAVLAMGRAEPDATTFTLVAERGSTVNGIVSGPFLERAFRTVRFEITVTVHDDGTWSYDQTTSLEVLGREGVFAHTDRHHLRRVSPPVLNPAARHD